ncbi:MAG: ligase-associated DNA damage response endonuclease PdeM, partial [Planctomycetota bacterium]
RCHTLGTMSEITAAPALDHAEFELLGERLVILADLALWWPDRRTLVITDTHFGKTAAFRSHGVGVPETTTMHDLARLTRLIEFTKATRLLHLGDLVHSAEGCTEAVMDQLAGWRHEHDSLEILLVEGNHDRRAGDLPRCLAIERLQSLNEGSFRFVHDPTQPEDSGRCLVGGHIHPAVRMHAGKRSERLKCFLASQSRVLLPAFGSFTGAMTVKPTTNDRVFVAHGNEICEVGVPSPCIDTEARSDRSK